MPGPMDQVMGALKTLADGQSVLIGEVKEMRAEFGTRLKSLERRADDSDAASSSMLTQLGAGGQRLSQLERRADGHDGAIDSMRPQVAVLQDARRRNSPSTGMGAVRLPLPSSPDADATGRLARAVELEAEQALGAQNLRTQQWKAVAPAVKILAAAIACGLSATVAVRCNASASPRPVVLPVPMVIASAIAAH